MENNESTKELYETISGYLKPPLIPLSDINSAQFFNQMGIKTSSFSCANDPHWQIFGTLFIP